MRRKGLAWLLMAAMASGMFAVPVSKAAPVVLPNGYNPSGVLYAEDKEAELQKQKEEAEKKRQELQKKKDAQAQKTKELKKEYDDIEKFIADMDQKQADMQAEMAEMEEALAELRSELAVTEKELAVAKEVEAEQYAALKRRFQYLYEHGNLTDLEVLLGSRDLEDILNYDEYATSIRIYDYLLAKKYSDAKHEVELVKEKQETQISVLEASLELYDEDYKYVEELVTKKEEALIEYEELIGVAEDDLEEYLSELNKANADVDALKQQIAKEQERKKAEAAKKAAEEAKKRAQQQSQQAAADREKKYANVPHTGVSSASDLTLKDVKDPNKMIWPLPGDNRIACGFGPRRRPVKGASSYHQGVDIGAAFGAQIVASLAGTVRFAGYNSSAGNYIEIDHGNGFRTRYLHCSKLLVSKGDTVLQGQVIALVGSTGVSTAPHLHFSVVIDGVSVDPLFYVRY